MLRFLSERRAWVAAAFVGLVLVIGLVLWGTPRATAHAVSLVRDRLGVDAHIDETQLALGGLELLGVEIRGRHGGFVARIDRVDVQVSLLGAIFQGSKSVRAVSARDVEVTVDLTDEGVGDSLAELRRRISSSSSASPSASTAGSGRTYSLQDLAVRMVDSNGTLVSMEGVSVFKEGKELRSNIDKTLLGDASGDHVAIGPSKVALRSSEGRWQLRELEIDGANVLSLRDGEDEETALVSRLREALSLLRSSGPTSEAEDSKPKAASSSLGLAPESARVFDRFTQDARIAVSGVQIESHTPGGRVERIQDLACALRGGDDGWYRITAGGQTSNDGTLKIDLNVMPSTARAEGSIELRGISLAVVAPFAPELPLHDTTAGTLSAELDLEASSSEPVSIEGHLQLRELALFSERIAPEPIEHINIDIRGKGVWHPAERLLRIERGQVQMAKARMLIEGELQRTVEHYRVDLTATIPPTRCNDVVGAIPQDILGSLSVFEWSGNWSALAHISLDSLDLEATELSIRVRNLCQFERIPTWVRVERFQEPFRHEALEPDESVFEMRTGPGTPNWVAFGNISPFVPAAVISHEDGAFYEHGGFAPWAIRDALVRNLQEGRYVVGASTISMQLAKNLFLHREKTIARKVQEVILTWWLENALNKDQILELYLNVIEYGPGVYGLRPAAAHYFGREPIDLSPAEAAFLACVLPSPKRYHLSYERGALTRSMMGSMRRLLEHMAKRQRIGPEALAYGLAELDGFRFHRPGDPSPAPRVLPPLGAPETPAPEALDPFEALFIAP